jgi:hypothetical protein
VLRIGGRHDGHLENISISLLRHRGVTAKEHSRPGYETRRLSGTIYRVVV